MAAVNAEMMEHDRAQVLEARLKSSNWFVSEAHKRLLWVLHEVNKADPKLYAHLMRPQAEEAAHANTLWQRQRERRFL